MKINIPGVINNRIFQNKRLLEDQIGQKRKKKSTHIHIIIKLKNKAKKKYSKFPKWKGNQRPSVM